MLVMSLSPLLGQAIPDIAETAKIVVFLRRGARSGGFREPKPQEENKSGPEMVKPRGDPGGPWGPKT